MIIPKKFPHLHQPDAMDCGAACLAMVAKYYGKNFTIQKLREICFASRIGVSMLRISDAAEKLGFKTLGICIGFDKLAAEVPLPCIVHWKQKHEMQGIAEVVTDDLRLLDRFINPIRALWNR